MLDLSPEIVIPVVVASYTFLLFAAAFTVFLGVSIGECLFEIVKTSVIWFLEWREWRKRKK